MIYCQAKKGANRMKKIAIIMALIMCIGGLTACGSGEVIEYPTEPTSKAVAEQSESTTENTTATKNVEDTTKVQEATAKAQKSEESTKVSENNRTEKSENSEASENSRVSNNGNTTNRSQSRAESSESHRSEETPKPKETEKATEKPTEKPTQKPTPKPTEKPQEKPDVYKAVSSAISYGCQLGMVYDSSLNTNNASWFSPTNAEYYTTTSELTSDCYSDVQYLVNYYGGLAASPSDISFNVVSVGSRIYVVYA